MVPVKVDESKELVTYPPLIVPDKVFVPVSVVALIVPPLTVPELVVVPVKVDELIEIVI